MKKKRRLYMTDYGLVPTRRIDQCAILCEDERILSIGSRSAFVLEPKLEIFELPNAYVTPGFVDTHIHGAGGFDSSSAFLPDASIELMSRILVERGVTTFVPTVVSAPREEMLRNLSALADMLDRPMAGAEAVGIHIEGPFLNLAKRGAQIEACLRPIDLGYARELLAAARGKVKRMTFAPELPGGVELTELLCAEHVAPSMGHSLADEAATLRAIDAGACYCTHLFNGMPPLQQRTITLTSIALTDSRVTVEMIIDGRHIHPRMVDLACRCKPSDKVVGISDATMAAGMANGEYRLGPSLIKVEDGYSHTGDGLLAGTTTLLDTGWHSLMSYSHMSETYAASAVSRNAALSLGLTDRGELLPGKLADLAFFEHGTNRPLLTVRRGEIVYKVEGAYRFQPANPA
ncbi:N-acetylglucosamine-6-phosphate deacetylase [Victivallis sp. Marseille-Q1083]|uniref:N-acetylglucosamine-6-phosphate deacetylase n=1 Tax=Victivallis sp. Marseille-Q1083 TaxID=2717288 RepID=UPI001589C61A|nr:N-acetylglucosamine-6-phosphate deacetylase [Victivallis sp. Marseille-Q1083]